MVVVLGCVAYCCVQLLVNVGHNCDGTVVNADNLEPRSVNVAEHSAHAIDKFSLPIVDKEIVDVHAEPCSQLYAVGQ